MRKFRDLTGQRFGRLVVIERAESRHGQSRWRCECDCGAQTEVYAASLQSGDSPSCGCLSREFLLSITFRHGHAKTKSLTYRIWCSMRRRCRSPKADSYPNYGGRGITVCERWNRFENFLADMGEAPAGHSIDRFPDTNGHYEPGNCRWATDLEQHRNRRDNILISLGDQTHCVTEWAELTGLKHWTIRRRLAKGLSAEMVLAT